MLELDDEAFDGLGGAAGWKLEGVRRLPAGEAVAARIGLDELAWQGPRLMIAAGLEAEVGDYVGRLSIRSMRRASGWWSATAGPGSVG